MFFIYPNNDLLNLPALMRGRPHATAVMRGSPAFPAVAGTVKFYQTRFGVLVAAEFTGLPTAAAPCENKIFGFHIHSGGSCTGNAEDPFADALTHDNPEGCPHPHHAGDLPPIFGASDLGFSLFLVSRFTVDEIIGKTVILHASPDDFTTQPAGNAGVKMACGVIL